MAADAAGGNMDMTIVVALIGLAGVVLGSLLTPLVSSIVQRGELNQVKAENERLQVRYEQLERDHLDLLDKALYRTNSRRLISFQLLVLDAYLLKRKPNSHPPILEMLGINSLGPIHQGRELIRDILKSADEGGQSGKVRLLLLDPLSDACRGECGRVCFETDKVGRLAAELQASLYILADIRSEVGAEAFSNFELRFHGSDPDRSLIMLNVGATFIDETATADQVVSAYADGVILENPYSRRRGERGMEGESRRWTPKRGGGENYYQDNIEYFRCVWRSATPVAIPHVVFEPTSILAFNRDGTRIL